MAYKIKLTPLKHRGQERIAIRFKYDETLKSIVKSIGARWSRTHTCFYISNNSAEKKKLLRILKANHCDLDYSAMLKEDQPHKPTKKSPNISQPICSKRHQEALAEFKRYLEGQRKSDSTINTYVHFIKLFLGFYDDRDFSDIDLRAVEIFIEDVIAKHNYSISSHRQCVSALKHFSHLKLDTNYDPENIKRPKKDRKLPNVLSSTEVVNLLKATKNLKHKAVLALIYSAGLRISELLKLELKDIDLERNLIHIKQSKGRKDRNTALGQYIKPVLISYAESYKPQKYLFESTKPGRCYSASSIRQFLKGSCRRAGITKHVTPHTLRHSYATHLLESGVDIRYIQELLGHSRPETTMIYTHVSEKKIYDIKNPLDEAINKFNKMDNRHKNLSLSRKKIR